MLEERVDAEGYAANRSRMLSNRELEVLRMASRGQTNAQIAGNLGVTVHAIKFHLGSIYRKLGVANRTEAAVWLLEHGPEPAR